jgi:regulator of nonsense transcripts 1
LERFIEKNTAEGLLPEEQVLRVSTDVTKVAKSLQNYTINARVGGDMNENNKLFKQAQDRVDKARLVFTTCAGMTSIESRSLKQWILTSSRTVGAGLGILRKVDFEITLIDEASQITEPCALIPLVKGVTKAVIVGDQ